MTASILRHGTRLGALLTVSILAGFAAEKASVSGPVPVGCHLYSVASHTFYGRAEDVTRAMAQLPKEFATNRFRLLMVETATGAELALYERIGDRYTLSTWRGKALGDLRQQLDRMYLKTRGSACAGAETRRMLAARGMALQTSNVNEPATLQEAFGPVLDRHRGGMLRVSLEDDCLPPPPLARLGGSPLGAE